MTLYVLEAEAVYRHGVIGVYETVEQACEAARSIWPDTDGHHRFVVTPYEVGETHRNVFEHTVYSRRGTVGSDVEVELEIRHKVESAG